MGSEHGSCLSPEILEEIALGGAVGPEVSAHIARCPICARYLETARFARRFGSVMNDHLPSDPNSADPLPEVFGYEVLEEIGRGGQGLVYKATQLATGQLVAIKVVHAQNSGPAPRARARFLREIQISASLNHPGIIRLMDSLKLSDGRDAIVMEYVEGTPLDVWIDEHPQIPQPEILRLLASVADALQHAHHRGVIHRDLKPSNILIDPSGKPHILDFGVARRNESGAINDRVTMTGEFTGTLAYAAPEQVMHDQTIPDIRTDLYALGLIACKVLTGELPYKVDGSLDSTVRNIIATIPSRQIYAGLEPDHWAVIAKAIAKEPDRRYQSASELAADLRNAASGRAIEARGTQRWYVLGKAAKKHRVSISLLVAVLLGLSATAISIAVGNTRLSEALRQSRVQQLRANIESNARDRAESILWSEAQRAVPHRADDLDALWSSPLAERELRWAFIEMQDRATCLYTGKIDSAPAINIDPLLDGRFAMISTDKRIGRVSIDHDRVLYAPGPQLSPDTIGGCFTPSGQLAVTMGIDLLRCVDTLSGQTLGSVPVISSLAEPGSLCVSDWGAVYNSTRGELVVLSLPNLDVLYRATGVPSTQLAWIDPFRRRVAFVGADGRARILDLDTGIESFPLADPVTDTGVAPVFPQVFVDPATDTMIIAHTGRILIAGSTGGRSTLRNLSREGYRISASLSHAGSVISAQAYGDSTLRLWDTATGEEFPGLPGHFGAVHLHAFSSDDTRILTIDRASVYRIWAAPGHRWRHPLSVNTSNTHQLALTDHGKRVIASDHREQMLVLPTNNADRSSTITDPRFPVQAVRFAVSDNSNLIAASDLDGRVMLLNQASPSSEPLVRELGDHDPVTGIRFGRGSDGIERIAVCTHNGRVLLLDTALSVLASISLADDVQPSDLRWSPDGSSIAVSLRTGQVIILDPEMLAIRRWIQVWTDQVRALAFSPDGRRIAAVGDSGRVATIDPRSGAVRTSDRISEDSVFTVAYHPSGRALCVGDRSGRITIIDDSTKQSLASFRAGGAVMSLEFSPDGSSVFVAALGSPIEQWDLSELAATFELLRPHDE